MSGPFNVGDVVVCVDDSPLPGCVTITSIKRGKTYRISGLGLSPRGFPVVRLLGVQLTEFAARGAGTHRFRHLPKADEQFTEQMRALKPIRKQVRA